MALLATGEIDEVKIPASPHRRIKSLVIHLCVFGSTMCHTFIRMNACQPKADQPRYVCVNIRFKASFERTGGVNVVITSYKSVKAGLAGTVFAGESQEPLQVLLFVNHVRPQQWRQLFLAWRQKHWVRMRCSKKYGTATYANHDQVLPTICQ